MLFYRVETRTVIQVRHENFVEEVAHRLFDAQIVSGNSIGNFFVDLPGSRSLEGRLARNELADQYAQRPDVNAVVVTRAVQDLRCNVNGSPALRKGLAAAEYLGKAEVDELQVALLLVRQHDVLGLQVAVDYLLCVHMLQGKDGLRRVQVAVLSQDGIDLGDLAQERAAVDEFQL